MIVGSILKYFNGVYKIELQIKMSQQDNLDPEMKRSKDKLDVPIRSSMIDRSAQRNKSPNRVRFSQPTSINKSYGKNPDSIKRSDQPNKLGKVDEEQSKRIEHQTNAKVSDKIENPEPQNRIRLSLRSSKSKYDNDLQELPSVRRSDKKSDKKRSKQEVKSDKKKEVEEQKQEEEEKVKTVEDVHKIIQESNSAKKKEQRIQEIVRDTKEYAAGKDEKEIQEQRKKRFEQKEQKKIQERKDDKNNSEQKPVSTYSKQIQSITRQADKFIVASKRKQQRDEEKRRSQEKDKEEENRKSTRQNKESRKSRQTHEKKKNDSEQHKSHKQDKSNKNDKGHGKSRSRAKSKNKRQVSTDGKMQLDDAPISSRIRSHDKKQVGSHIKRSKKVEDLVKEASSKPSKKRH